MNFTVNYHLKLLWIIPIILFFVCIFDTHANEKNTKDVVQMNHIQIDKQKKEIRLKVRLSITQGILEYLLVSDYGKAYESIFKISNNLPSELNFALLLIGCDPMPFKDLEQSKKDISTIRQLKRKYPKSFLEINLFYNGKQIDLKHLINNREKAKGQLNWIYTGGLMYKNNKYAGDIELSFIGIWPDPTAPINLISGNGNPYHGNLGFEMSIKDQEIKKYTDIEMIIKIQEDNKQ